MKFSFIKCYVILNILLLIACYHSSSEEKGTGRIGLTQNMKDTKPFVPENLPTTNTSIVTLTPMQVQNLGVQMTPVNTDLGTGPIKLKAWVQYFKYSDSEISETKTPTKFYTNNEYTNQLKTNPGVNLSETDVDRTLRYIKQPTYFWLTLFDSYLNVSTCKQVSDVD
jgi:hypothetical protein